MDAVVIAMVTTSGLVMNELLTMVVDNLVELLLEQEAKDGSDNRKLLAYSFFVCKATCYSRVC